MKLLFNKATLNTLDKIEEIHTKQIHRIYFLFSYQGDNLAGNILKVKITFRKDMKFESLGKKT